MAWPLIVFLAIAWAAPVLAVGVAILVWARNRSLLLSTVVLALMPVLATFAGLIGVSQFMFTDDFTRTVTVLVAVAAVTLIPAVALGRYQARRTVWERQIREQEREAEQSRRDLIAWVSHDLRTPLAEIRAMAEAIRESVITEPDEITRYAELIGNDVVWLSAMVDDLFDMAKLNAGAMPLQVESMDLREVIDEVCSPLQVPAEQSGITLTVASPETVVAVQVSASAIARALTNVVINALAHTPANGTISVTVQDHRDSALITVDDTGTGISPEALPHIFDAAFRGTSARTPTPSGLPKSGSGMGLAIAHGLITAHSGTITATSLTPGTRFCITLPKAGPHDDAPVG